MTMSNFDVSAVDLSAILNKQPEEKAKQLPDPASYYLLCMLPKAEDEYDNGILKAEQTMMNEELLSPVLWSGPILAPE
jgi:hypothetical protein